jgi:nucleotide-binding universal stress UspA family protein
MKSVIALVDGSTHAEAILPFAAEVAKAARVDCELLQVLPAGNGVPRDVKADILETAYLARSAEHLKRQFDLSVAWDILHGTPAESICEYVSRRTGIVFAMTSHIRTPLQHAVLGSVASECMCRSGVPAFVYGLGDSFQS